jgi:hypothetical protein
MQGIAFSQPGSRMRGLRHQKGVEQLNRFAVSTVEIGSLCVAGKL